MAYHRNGFAPCFRPCGPSCRAGGGLVEQAKTLGLRPPSVVARVLHATERVAGKTEGPLSRAFWILRRAGNYRLTLFEHSAVLPALQTL